MESNLKGVMLMFRQYSPYLNQYDPYMNQFDPYQSQQQFPPFFPPFPLPGRQPVIDSGSAQKNRTGALRVRFNRRFSRVPTVVVTPFWRGQNSQVAFIETITDVTTSGFTVVSDNAANNYFVNWIAVAQD